MGVLSGAALSAWTYPAPYSQGPGVPPTIDRFLPIDLVKVPFAQSSQVEPFPHDGPTPTLHIQPDLQSDALPRSVLAPQPGDTGACLGSVGSRYQDDEHAGDNEDSQSSIDTLRMFYGLSSKE